MEIPKPTPAHDRLKKFIGRWRGTETLSPSPWDPEGGTATGIVENKLILDGFAVVQEYAQMRGDVVGFRGHGVITYNGREQCYTMHWFDSMGMPPNFYKGNFEGDVLKLTNRFPQGFSRAAWQFGGEKEYSFRMEVSPDGEKWAPMIVGTYTREG